VRYFLDPFGCVKNQVDAETIMACLNRAGMSASESTDDADVIIINSCGFIQSAKQESINAVLAARKTYPDKKIVLAGCLAQRYAGELAGALPEADLLFGNRDLSKISGAVRSLFDGEQAAESPGVFDAGLRPLLSLPGSAYVKISEGCNNRCSFCAIPNIRGSLRSRPVPDILTECRQLLERGIRELCLIGQDLGSYGGDGPGSEAALPELLEALSRLEGRFWIRLLYIHPDNFPRALLDICAGDSRIVPYFDLPFQHGSGDILPAMNRRGNAGYYLELISAIRARLSDAVIRSTFLLGFPGESDEDFAALLDFQDKARLDWLGCFIYSREEGTPAYSMKKRVPKKIAVLRKNTVEERQTAITEERMDRFVGRDFTVLVEEAVDKENGLYLGRLPCQAPEVDGAAVISADTELRPGDFVRGRVFARSGFDLEVSVTLRREGLRTIP
jgi:ribosomal protein S12 methylthiotransferase